ncbi:MAG: serine hydrolase [bacterium]
MFDFFANLLLAGLFMNFSIQNNQVIDNFSNSHLPEAGYRQVVSVVPEIVQNLPQKKVDASSTGVSVSADSVLVIDAETGKILYAKGTTDKRSIASITKLMTALVFMDHKQDWDKTWTISSTDYRAGAVAYLNSGDVVSTKDIFYTAMVASANEGAAALARITGLSQQDFVAEMNKKAVDLGMINSHFADPTGLDNNNESTAQDIAILAQTAFNNPDIFRAVQTNNYQITIQNKKLSRKIFSTDKILGQSFGWDDNTCKVEAGKTGYIEKAGYCFASQISDEHGKKIIVVVLGSATLNDRFTDTKSLAYWVFKNYEWQN